ncbi:MAG: putative addiction module antidote protein [Candidatus Hydrogenedentes bacterium]|nr:putative addiction module antidote protein [Candidatus Hydrogenedentota bacterium]
MGKSSKPYNEGLFEWLKSTENQLAYLKASVEENSDMPEALLMAIRDIAEVRGYEALAREAGLSQKALYKILSDEKEAKPRLETVSQILNALGLRLTVEPLKRKRLRAN